jgi:hypothetical protein
MPPRRPSAPPAESKTGLVVALVFFVLLSIVLGVTTYLGFDGQKELEQKASTAAQDAKKANDLAAEARAQRLACRIMMGIDPAPRADEFGAVNSNPAFQTELAAINAQFGSVGVNWDPKTGTPPESILVVMKKLKEAKETAESNMRQALADAQKANTDYQAKAASEEAKAKQAQAEAQKFAATAAQAQKAEQDAKLFAIADINKLRNDLKTTREKADEEIANLNVRNKRLEEALEGAKITIDKLKADQDARRVSILLTDVKHGTVTRVDAATDTAFINLGSADFVRPGMSFSVLQSFDRSRYSVDQPLPKKASLTVAQVLGPKLSRATIQYADDVNPTKDPVRAGDALYKPGWRPGTPARWALVGHFDLNGLGRDETQILIERLKREGISVVAYLDLTTLQVVGNLDHTIDYVVVGNRPTLKTAQVIGDERKQAIENAINDFIAKAQGLGIQVIQHRLFLPIAGIDLPREEAFPYFPGGPGGGKSDQDMNMKEGR